LEIFQHPIVIPEPTTASVYRRSGSPGERELITPRIPLAQIPALNLLG